MFFLSTGKAIFLLVVLVSVGICGSMASASEGWSIYVLVGGAEGVALVVLTVGRGGGSCRGVLYEV